MKIGILGPGDVGQALGNAFGHEVRRGSRHGNSAKATAWAHACKHLRR